MRTLSLVLLAICVGGCTVIDASPETTAIVARMEAVGSPVPRQGEVIVYSDLANVSGQFQVVGPLQVARDGRDWPEIEAELRALALAQGANGLVMHPFSRRTLGVVYAPGSGEPDPFRDARATAIRINVVN